MGMYAFIFACISIGILLWFVSEILVGELNSTLIENIGNGGTILFIVGVISLTLIFFGILKR